jgi:hypothetical protein
MINLNYSSSNILSVLPDVSGLSLSNNNLLIDFTQSYDLSGKGDIEGTITKYNTFLTFNIPANTLPTASGQYKIDIYTTSGSAAVKYKWIQIPTTFTTTKWTWLNGGTPNSIIKDQLISTTHGYVNGTNTPVTIELADGDMLIVRYTEPILNPVFYNPPTSSNIYYQYDQDITQYTSSNEYGEYETYNL